jgi:hypothetical protein
MSDLENDANRLDLSNGANINDLESYPNGTGRFKNVNNCLKSNNSCFLETSGGQISHPHLNVVHFFYTRVD